MNACNGVLERFIEQTNNTDDRVDVASLVGGKNSYSDLLWLAGKKLPKDRIVEFACDCALINVELIKPYCKEEDYDLIIEFLSNPALDAFDAAFAAFDAAFAAVDAAAVAVDAAAVAAVAAARAAARAAFASSPDQANALLIKMFEEVQSENPQNM